MGRLILVFILIVIVFTISGCVLSDAYWMRKEQEKSERYVNKHPDIDNRIKKFILANTIGAGMTKEEVKLCVSYRYPDKIMPTSKYGADEMWVYDKPYENYPAYLYFKDNILVEIEPKVVKDWHIRESERQGRIRW